MSTQVLIPWRADGSAHREDALAFVLMHYEATYPDWEVCVCVHPPDGAWSKATALMGAAAADTLVIADADVFTIGPGLELAHRRVEQDVCGWAIPHYLVHRLTREASERLMLFGHPDPQDLPTDERPYRGIQGGGVVVIGRELFERCPMDPRFIGWGGEDQAWAVALSTLGGRAWRGDDALVHLWHPPQDRRSRKRGSRENSALYRRYCLARQDPEAMRELLAEVA